MTEEEDRIRASFEEWKATLPKCLSYEGGCDGDLEGGAHEDNCPMKGLESASHFDAFKAGAEFARSEREARKPKIYKAPETPKVCEECDSTCFVTAGGEDLVCYYCHLISECESELESRQKRGDRASG